jgi:PAS domain-containing protein
MLSAVVLARMGAAMPVVIMLAPVMAAGNYHGYATRVPSLAQVQGFIDKSVNHSAMLFTLLDRNGKVIMSNRADQQLIQLMQLTQPFARGPGVTNRLDAGIAQWLPVLDANTPILERWKNSFYVTSTEVDELSGWTLILEQPAAPFQQALFERYANKLALLFLVLLSALALAEWLSRRSVSTLKMFSHLTQDLPNRLTADAHALAWPTSHVVETKQLIDNFRRMGESLTAQLQAVPQVNESLERRAHERSAVLMQCEERLRTVIEQTREAIAIHRHGRVIFANPTAVALGEASTAQEVSPAARGSANQLAPAWLSVDQIRWH